MTPTDDLALAEGLCARLCHDLAGPLGAAAAGAELLEDGVDADTVSLVAASAAGAVARLKFFRAAMGPAGSGQPAAALRDLCAAYLTAAASAGGTGLTLSWRSEVERLDGNQGRLVLNLVLIARDALARGGEVRVDIGADTLAVGFAGQGAGLSDEVHGVLVAPPEKPTAPVPGARSHSRIETPACNRFDSRLLDA